MRHTSTFKLVVCAIAAVSTVSAYESWELRGPEYQAKTAEEKHDMIWNRCIADETS